MRDWAARAAARSRSCRRYPPPLQRWSTWSASCFADSASSGDTEPPDLGADPVTKYWRRPASIAPVSVKPTKMVSLSSRPSPRASLDLTSRKIGSKGRPVARGTPTVIVRNGASPWRVIRFSDAETTESHRPSRGAPRSSGICPSLLGSAGGGGAGSRFSVGPVLVSAVLAVSALDFASAQPITADARSSLAPRNRIRLTEPPDSWLRRRRSAPYHPSASSSILRRCTSCAPRDSARP